MATPVNERVQRHRERQRQAHPQEPQWHTLIGRLHVADIWLSQGGSAPAGFADTIRIVGRKLGLDIREELPCRGYGAQHDVDNSE